MESKVSYPLSARDDVRMGKTEIIARQTRS